jgi:hypothetical protein
MTRRRLIERALAIRRRSQPACDTREVGSDFREFKTRSPAAHHSYRNGMISA